MRPGLLVQLPAPRSLVAAAAVDPTRLVRSSATLVSQTTERSYVYGCPVLQALLLVVGGSALFTIVSDRTVRA